MLEESRFYFQKAADLLDLSEKIRTLFVTPLRVIKVELITEGDDGLLIQRCNNQTCFLELEVLVFVTLDFSC